MPDPFDFLSTRLNPEVSIFQQDRLNLLPSVPADFRRSDGTTNPGSVFDMLESRLSQLPNNLPAYEYGSKEERRYSNPYLQYTPTNVLGTDTEDMYGRFQGPGEQLWNSFVKMGANAVGTFSSSFADLPRQLDAIRSGNFSKLDFEEGKAFEHIQEWLTALEDKFPNYYTSLERNRSDWFNAFSPTGAMNFWGDKVIKNIGFSLGGLASGLVVDAALELASGGTATPVTYIAAANQFNKFYKNLFRGFRNLVKSGENIDKAIDITKATGSLAKGLEVSNLAKLGTIGRYSAAAYLSAQGESFIEGYHTYVDTKRGLLEEAIQRGEVDSNTLRDIEDRAQKAGKWTTAMNIPILVASNFIQFPNLLSGKSMLSPINTFIKNEIGEEGIKAVSQFSTKNALKAWAKETFKDVFTEGFEEGAQYHISNSLHDYYSDRLNPKIKTSMLGFLMDNIPETLTDSQFWSEATIGGISGALMGQIHNAQIFGKEASTNELVGRLNSSYERFNSLVKQYAKSIDLNTLEDERDIQISTNDALFAAVHDSLKYGTYETFMDALNDLKDLNLDQYNKAFGTEYANDDERNAAVDAIIKDSIGIKESVLKVNQFYPKNPYSKPYLLDKIKKAFSPKSETELNTIQQNLFNDYKEVIARNQFMLKKTNGEILKYKDRLKTFGVKDEAISYIASLNTTKKGFKAYLRWKKSQLDDLSRQVAYYDELSKADTTLTPELDPKKEHAAYSKLLKETTEYYDLVQDFYKRMKENPDKKELKDLLLLTVLHEETNSEDRERFVENRKKDAEELQKRQQDADALEVEEKDLTSENPKTAEGILEGNIQAAEESVPLNEKKPAPKPKKDPNEWLKKHNIGDVIKGKKIISIQEDHLVTQDNLGNTYKVTKQGNKFKETSDITGVPDIEEPQEMLREEEKPIETEEQVEPFVESTNEELSLGEEEFTAEEIFNYPDTVWMRVGTSMENSVKIYSVEEDGVHQRQIVKSKQFPAKVGEVRSKIRATAPEELKHFSINSDTVRFKQILEGSQIPVTKEVKTDQTDKNLDEFLGNYKELKPIFKKQIDRGKFELIC